MRKIFTLLAIMATGLTYSQSITDSLLLHYPFSGNANDLSGNGFNGVSNATPTANRLGVANEAYSFNGTNQFIDLPNVAALKPEAFPISFSFWVKLDNLQPENSVLFTTDFAQNNHSGVWMNLSSTGLLAINYGDATGNTSSSNRRTKVGTTELNIDQWYHIAGIINGPTDMEIFIDCVNDNGTYQGSGGDLEYTTNPGSIGRKDGNFSLPSYYFKGSMDDFYYWNRALTIDNIDVLCKGIISSSDEASVVQNKIFVYPNPVSDIFRIDVENYNEIGYMVLTNTTGQLIDQRVFQPEVTIGHLDAGFYFLQVFDKDENLIDVIKILKD